eukprot:s163_g25.t1
MIRPVTSWLKPPAMPWPVESPKFWLRHGGGVPSYDLPAKVGSPKGLRLKGPVATEDAYNELRDRGFLKGPRLLELGKSFYAVKSRHGASLHGVVMDEGKASESTALHSVVALESLPRCRALLHKVLDLLGLDRSKLKDSLANGMARRYKPGSSLPRHVDNTEMFQEPVLAIVLKSGDVADGLRLCHRTGVHGGGGVRIIAEASGALEGDPAAKFRVEPGYQIQECDGMVVSLEGPSRYDFAHEVPPVSATRVSLTWRWFDEDFLQQLRQREAKLRFAREQKETRDQKGSSKESTPCRYSTVVMIVGRAVWVLAFARISVGSAIAPVLVGLADAVSSWSLPTWLDCVGSAVTSADESVTVYKVLSFALPGALDGLPGLASDISDKESGCLFWDLLRSRPDPLLFRLLRREPVLSLVLSDLGQLVTDFTTNTTDFSGDLTLEPWFQAHCESGVAVYTMRSEDCQNNDFRTAVLEQEHHWKTVASGLYGPLVSEVAIEIHFPDCLLSSVCLQNVFGLEMFGDMFRPCVTFIAEVTLSVYPWCSSLQLVYSRRSQQSQLRNWPAPPTLPWWDLIAAFLWESPTRCWKPFVVRLRFGLYTSGTGHGEPLALMFQEYQQDWAESEDEKNEAKYQELLIKLASFLQSQAPADLLQPDLFLCTRPFLFCWLLRDLWPGGLPQVPMLHYYSGPLLFDTTEAQKLRVLKVFQQTVLTSTLDLVVSSSVLQSAWMLSMAGTAVPHVRPHATSLRGLYVPPQGEQLSGIRALVMRSTWVGSIMAQAFQNVFAEMDAEHPSGVTLEWLGAGKFLSYQEIANFHAALFFPEQPDKLTFWEQYEMSMPLWLPSSSWWSKIHALGEFRYSVFGHRWFAELSAVGASRSCFPQAVFFETDEPKRHWKMIVVGYELTDYALFPHLQQFNSAVDLVTSLLAADFLEIHRAMAIFNEATWQRSASFYRAAVSALLSPGRLNEGATNDPPECAKITDFWTNHHECVKPVVQVEVNHFAQDCWERCQIGGDCKWCGSGSSACCRKNSTLDPPECQGVVDWPTDRHHTCVTPVKDVEVKHEGQDCFDFCGGRGSCNWCGEGNACCKYGDEFDVPECRAVVLVECSLILWPSLPLLLIPTPWARQFFLRLAGFGQAAWLGLAVTCLRFVSKTKIYIHSKGMTLQEMQQMSGDLLMISNHPSRIDWMFHWAVAIALGRLAHLKIVLKDSLRRAPGFGWAMQCNSYPFVCRKDRDKDLETLRRVSFLGGEGLKSAILLFPEGTDLSDSNLQKSHAHAEKEGLSKYTQVLHPRTAGLETALSAMMEVAEKKQAEKPSLLDITVAYVHQVPGELPNEVKFFGKGECVEEVHMLLQRIPLDKMDTGDAAKLCTQLWKEKEEMG